MKTFPSILIACVCAPALAQPAPADDQFIGRWKSDNPASATPDALLTIEGAAFTWRPNAKAPPQCRGTFARQNEKPGTVYLDAHGRKFVAGAIGSFPTYLLKVDPGTCGGADGWRISFPVPYDRRHMELTEYVGGRPTGYRKMQKVD